MVNLNDYFDEEKLKEKKCIVYTQRKKAVYMEEKDGEVYFIKKYMPHGKKAIKINLNLKKDFAINYKCVSEILKKIGIPHVEPLGIEIRKKSFFKRESIIVTKYGGESLEHWLRELELEKQKKYIDLYFQYYIQMFQNKLYVTDYNLTGALIDNEGTMKLIDFDAYKRKVFLTNKFKNHLYKQLKKGSTPDKRDDFSEETVGYLREKAEETAKICGLK